MPCKKWQIGCLRAIAACSQERSGLATHKEASDPGTRSCLHNQVISAGPLRRQLCEQNVDCSVKILAVAGLRDKLKISAPAEQGQVAQLVEQRTENPCVAGSTPVLPIALNGWLPSTYVWQPFSYVTRYPRFVSVLCQLLCTQ
jgi:hypothetical protein